MDEKEKIACLEREIELLKEIVRLREEANKLAQPVYIPQPYLVNPWPVYPQVWYGVSPFFGTSPSSYGTGTGGNGYWS